MASQQRSASCWVMRLHCVRVQRLHQGNQPETVGYCVGQEDELRQLDAGDEGSMHWLGGYLF